MMDGFSHRGAVRKLTLSRQIPSDTFQPAIACLLSNGLSAIMDNCEAFLVIASNIGTHMGLFTYRVIENGCPKDSPCAYCCYQFLLLLPLAAMKSHVLADPLIPLLIVHHNRSDDGRWCHVVCDTPSPTGLPQV